MQGIEQMFEAVKTQMNGETLGDRLRKKRREMGWTQEQLAAKAGTTQAVIQKIENGKSLRPRKIDEIAAPLGVLPAWLMFGDNRFDSLDQEAMEVVSAWSRLNPVDRALIKQQIMVKATAS